MGQYILKRVSHAILVTLLVTSLVFGFVRAIPGDPISILLPEGSPSAKEALRAELGLDQPIYIQYLKYLADLVQGDLGDSIYAGQPVLDLILQVAEPTISIALLGFLIATIFSIPGGVFAAVQQHRPGDHLVSALSLWGISLPAFFYAILLIMFVARPIGPIPAFGYSPLEEGIVEWFLSILLPAIAVAFPTAGVLTRMTRSSMLDVLGQDYIRTARAKGLDDRIVIYKHGLQNAIIPVVTVMGISLALLIVGTVAVEIVFGIRGMGRLLIRSLSNRDFPVVQGATIIIAVVFVFANLGVDILYTLINPQIKYGDGE